MKKVKIVMLGLCLVLGLAACGKESEVTSTNESKVVSNEIAESKESQNSTVETKQETTEQTTVPEKKYMNLLRRSLRLSPWGDVIYEQIDEAIYRKDEGICEFY